MPYKPDYKYYVILLPNDDYLCYPDSRQVILYRYTDTQTMAMDLELTKGELRPLTPELSTVIFYGTKYTNNEPTITGAELRLELAEAEKRGESLDWDQMAF